MAKLQKKTKSTNEYSDDKFFKSQNEQCFLKDKQKIKYHSFILLEIVPLESVNTLISGLDKIYSNLTEREKSKLNYKSTLQKTHSKLFEKNISNLPFITTDKLKKNGISRCVYHNLGDNIMNIRITIYQVYPSNVILQIQVYLDKKVSININNIVYSYHNEIRKTTNTPDVKYTDICLIPNQKESEIYSFRKNLHKEAFKFLKKYFKGYFFKQSNNNLSIVPTIDIFSLNYPVNDDEISDWGIENRNFFNCFSSNISPYYCYKSENYIFCYESRRNGRYSNYLVFANRDESYYQSERDIDNKIIVSINRYYFDLLAIDRWIDTQESIAGNLNLKVSKEISNIQDDNFNNAITSRKEIMNSTFVFERFALEFKSTVLHDRGSFINLKNKHYPDMNMELFESFKIGIDRKIDEIQNFINGFTKQYETVLNLKNLEFSKNIQNKVITLTIVVIILAIIQIFLNK